MSAYTTIEYAGKTAIVSTPNAQTISAALFHGTGCAPLSSEGRGQVYRFPCGDDWGVLRRCQRGGLPGFFLQDQYLLRNRPLEEFQVHVALHEKGVPCPEPLGVLWEKRGPLYRGALATRLIEGASLQALLSGDVTNSPLDSALHAAGEAVRTLHEVGGLHADLHPANILVARGQAYLIDFDRARILAALTPGQRASNLLRLRRAFVKHGFALPHFDAFMQGYGIPPGSGFWQGALAAVHEAAVKPKKQ